MEVDVLIHSEAGGARAERLEVLGPISIGRHASCVLRLEGDHVSRTHCVVEAREEAIVVEDRSSNGTLAGELLLRRSAAEVPYGTPITIGGYTLQISPASPDAPLPSFANTRPPQRIDGFSVTSSYPSSNGSGRLVEDQPTYLGQELSGRPDAPAWPEPPKGSIPGFPLPSDFEKVLIQENLQMSTVMATGALPADPLLVASALEKESTLRKEIHKRLLENLDLAKLDNKKIDDPSMRPRVLAALRRIVDALGERIDPATDRDALVGELADEALGLGPLERFLSDVTISEVMVVDPSTIYVEQGGVLVRTGARFTDDERVRAVIERIVTPLGRRIDESSPLVDARLKDGSRVNAIIRPLALRGSCITIRKFARTPLTVEKLISFGTLTQRMSTFLQRSVTARKNIIVSGGTGSGKTTLLNVLSSYIPDNERIVTIEDAAELQLRQPHVVSLESRPPNLEGKGEYTIRDLVKNSLRMRPDRIVIGECRGGEALDMLQAMNTGHDGSLTTTHANSPAEAVTRIETLVLMSGVDLPSRAIRENIANSIHLVVQQERFSDGTRRISEISEVVGIDEGEIVQQPIFKFIRTGTGPRGEVIGEHRATGYLPSFLDEFLVMGLIRKGEPFL